MPAIKEIIQSYYPKIDDMPFCAALRDGRFGRTEILRSEIVELYRALNTRHLIQNAYKEKLHEALKNEVIRETDVEVMEEVIDDEGETEEHIDHLDMRFKLFVGTPVSRACTLKTNAELEAINAEWIAVCNESDLFSLMSVTAAIEDWYAPLSGFFEEEYRKRGFSDDELELFIIHKGADVEHSDAQFDILERNHKLIDENKARKMLERTFNTSRGYDTVKLKLAETECELEALLAA
jgi:hypothetical protein